MLAPVIRGAIQGGVGLLGVLLLCAGCEDAERKPAPPAPEVRTAPAPAPVPQPKAPPAFAIDDQGPKVGFETVFIDKPGGRAELSKALDEVKEHIVGKVLDVNVERNARLTSVTQMFAALAERGATSFLVHTVTRDDYPKQLTFMPASVLGAAAPCAVVATILEDRSTAVWKLSGGTAIRSRRGLGGPDLSMTANSLSRLAKACDKSHVLFVQAFEDVGWGLTYDLAASGAALEDAGFEQFVLLPTAPVAGRAVQR